MKRRPSSIRPPVRRGLNRLCLERLELRDLFAGLMDGLAETKHAHNEPSTFRETRAAALWSDPHARLGSNHRDVRQQGFMASNEGHSRNFENRAPMRDGASWHKNASPANTFSRNSLRTDTSRTTWVTWVQPTPDQVDVVFASIGNRASNFAATPSISANQALGNALVASNSDRVDTEVVRTTPRPSGAATSVANTSSRNSSLFAPSLADLETREKYTAEKPRDPQPGLSPQHSAADVTLGTTEAELEQDFQPTEVQIGGGTNSSHALALTELMIDLSRSRHRYAGSQLNDSTTSPMSRGARQPLFDQEPDEGMIAFEAACGGATDWDVALARSFSDERLLDSNLGWFQSIALGDLTDSLLSIQQPVMGNLQGTLLPQLTQPWRHESVVEDGWRLQSRTLHYVSAAAVLVGALIYASHRRRQRQSLLSSPLNGHGQPAGGCGRT